MAAAELNAGQNIKKAMVNAMDLTRTKITEKVFKRTAH